MQKHVEEFARRVKSAMTRDGNGLTEVHWAIENGYDQVVVPSGMTKSFFLDSLREVDGEVFDITVEHLFTPINWSHLKMTQMWGIKNTATGNLMTLTHDREDDTFHLRETTTENEETDISPMVGCSEDEVREFVGAIQRDYEQDEPSVGGVGDALIMLNIEEGVNPMNFEVVPVRMIF